MTGYRNSSGAECGGGGGALAQRLRPHLGSRYPVSGSLGSTPALLPVQPPVDAAGPGRQQARAQVRGSPPPGRGATPECLAELGVTALPGAQHSARAQLIGSLTIPKRRHKHRKFVVTMIPAKAFVESWPGKALQNNRSWGGGSESSLSGLQ